MVTTVTSTTLTLQTDLTESPPLNTPGILHGKKQSWNSARLDTTTLFLWVADSTHLAAAVAHLSTAMGYNADSLLFIPYSNKENWIKNYSYAIPSMECDEEGVIVTVDTVPSLPAMDVTSSSLREHTSSKQRKKSQRKAGIELLPSSMLTNPERDALHIEIYKYFNWLKTALEEVEVIHAGKRTLGNACANSANVDDLRGVMESVFKVVGENDVAGVNSDNNIPGRMGDIPMLERILGGELAKLVVKAPIRGGSHKREQGDFENYWSRLMEFKEKHGHSNVPVRYKEDLKLGKWISNIRQKRKQMNAQKEEEPELDADGQPKTKRQRPMQIGAVTLTPERMERFNAIDFAWDLTGPTKRQSWEVRFEQCMEFYRANGRWPPHSHGTLGEWVHKQRCKWARKDKTFMEKYYDKLEEVGFLWKVKERNNISWDARIEQLIEFGRLNGHFQVPNPDYDDVDNSEGTSVEAARFYKWVNNLHTEYEAFKNGVGSNVLNGERVLQLIKMGFPFHNMTAAA